MPITAWPLDAPLRLLPPISGGAGLPTALQRLREELEAVRAEVLGEAEGLSRAQAEWRPSERDWSVGEIIHHLTLAEINTGKLISKLMKEGGERGALRPYPAEVREFEPLPPSPPGPAEAPPAVRPERGRALVELLRDMKATRQRTYQNLERLAAVDPRPLTWKHFALGELHLAQWVALQARHDGIHLEQIRQVKAAPGFPRS